MQNETWDGALFNVKVIGLSLHSHVKIHMQQNEIMFLTGPDNKWKNEACKEKLKATRNSKMTRFIVQYKQSSLQQQNINEQSYWAAVAQKVERVVH